MRLLFGNVVAVILSAFAPASAAPQREVNQAEYEQFLECLGVVHAKT